MREDLYLKELKRFTAFLQRLLDREFSSKEALREAIEAQHFECGISELLANDRISPDTEIVLQTLSEQHLHALLKYYLAKENSNPEMVQLVRRIYNAKTTTYDLTMR